MLPPVMVMKAGALQPLAVRQLTTPLPCSPPTMNPPLVNLGTTAMHFALPSNDDGIGLPPVVMFCTVSVAAVRTLLLSTAHIARAHNGRSAMIDKILLIIFLLVLINGDFALHLRLAAQALSSMESPPLRLTH